MLARSVLITGSNRGLGLEFVKQLALNKNPPEFIIATCRTPDKAEELKKLSSEHENIYITHLDVTNEATYGELVTYVQELVGSKGLNLLINNAGYAPKSTRINMVKWQQMSDTLCINTVAPLMLTKALLPLLSTAASSSSQNAQSVEKAAVINMSSSLGSIGSNDQGGLYPYRASKALLPLLSTAASSSSQNAQSVEKAAVINMSSSLGSIGSNDQGGLYPYRASKAALNAITKSLSLDLKGHNILVTSIHPGWVQTDMGGKNAPLTPELSISEMIKTFYSLNEKHNGGFFRYDGQELPW